MTVGGQGGLRSSAEGPVGHIKKHKKQTVTSKRLEAEADRVDGRGYEVQKSLDIIDFNGWAEQRFQEIVRGMIEASGRDEVRLSRVLPNCAYEIGVGVGTVRRYVIKHCADRGPFRLGTGGKSIGLNPYWRPPQRYEPASPGAEEEGEGDDD